MLVITRKPHQSVMIGDRIEVTVVRVGHDGVRLGITAPADVTVHRCEVYTEICTANRSAASGAADRLIELARAREPRSGPSGGR